MLPPAPTRCLPSSPPSDSWPPAPGGDTYNPRERFPLHHVHELHSNLLPTAALRLLGAGTQVGTADDILMVHQGPVPWWLLPRKRYLWAGCHGLVTPSWTTPGKVGGKAVRSAGAFHFYFVRVVTGLNSGFPHECSISAEWTEQKV